MKRLLGRSGKASALGAALLITVPLALSGCGSSSSASASSGAAAGPATVHVLDYYNEGNDNKVIGAALTACGKANNLTVVRDAVPGRRPDPEGTAAVVVEDAAGRADAGQPGHAADRRVRGAHPAVGLRDQHGRLRTGHPAGGHLQEQDLRARTDRELDRAVLQQGRADQGRHHPADDLGRTASRCQEADQWQPVRHRARRQRHLRGQLDLPAVHVVQRWLGEGHHHP